MVSIKFHFCEQNIHSNSSTVYTNGETTKHGIHVPKNNSKDLKHRTIIWYPLHMHKMLSVPTSIRSMKQKHKYIISYNEYVKTVKFLINSDTANNTIINSPANLQPFPNYYSYKSASMVFLHCRQFHQVGNTFHYSLTFLHCIN